MNLYDQPRDVLVQYIKDLHGQIDRLVMCLPKGVFDKPMECPEPNARFPANGLMYPEFRERGTPQGIGG